MDSATSKDTKFSKKSVETPKTPKGGKGKTDGYMGLSKSDLKKRIAEVAKEFGSKSHSRDFKVQGGLIGNRKTPFYYELPNGERYSNFKTEREALTSLLKESEKLIKKTPGDTIQIGYGPRAYLVSGRRGITDLKGKSVMLSKQSYDDIMDRYYDKVHSEGRTQKSKRKSKPPVSIEDDPRNFMAAYQRKTGKPYCGVYAEAQEASKKSKRKGK